MIVKYVWLTVCEIVPHLSLDPVPKTPRSTHRHARAPCRQPCRRRIGRSALGPARGSSQSHPHYLILLCFEFQIFPSSSRTLPSSTSRSSFFLFALPDITAASPAAPLPSFSFSTITEYVSQPAFFFVLSCFLDGEGGDSIEVGRVSRLVAVAQPRKSPE